MANVGVLRKATGQRRHKVTLQEDVVTIDALGGREQDFESFGTAFVSIDSQTIGVTETEAGLTFSVQMHYHPAFWEKFLAGKQLRIVATDYTLKVLNVVNPEQRNRDLVLTCGKTVV